MKLKLIRAALMVWVAAGGGGVACGGKAQAQGAPFSESLVRDETLWGDGKAEVSVFDAVEPRYGAARNTQVSHYLVRETFSPEAPVKTEDWRRQGAYPVIKLNQVWSVPTGSYRYDQGVSLFWRAGGAEAGEFFRLSHTTSDSCGLSYKRADLERRGERGPAWRYRAFTYWENGDAVDFSAEAPEGGLFYDEMPFRLRTLDWKRATLFEAPLLPSLVGSRAEKELRWATARFFVERIREGRRVTVKHAGGTDQLVFDAEPPHALNSWKRADGGSLKRVQLVRMPYWELSRPGDEKFLRPGATHP